MTGTKGTGTPRLGGEPGVPFYLTRPLRPRAACRDEVYGHDQRTAFTRFAQALVPMLDYASPTQPRSPCPWWHDVLLALSVCCLALLVILPFFDTVTTRPP
jgi:hypothetical protein